jgi:hypothetical protein
VQHHLFTRFRVLWLVHTLLDLVGVHGVHCPVAGLKEHTGTGPQKRGVEPPTHSVSKAGLHPVCPSGQNRIQQRQSLVMRFSRPHIKFILVSPCRITEAPEFAEFAVTKLSYSPPAYQYKLWDAQWTV